MIYPKDFVELVKSLLTNYQEMPGKNFKDYGFKLAMITSSITFLMYKNYSFFIDINLSEDNAIIEYSEITFNDHICFNSNNGLIKTYYGGHVSEFPVNFFDWTEEDFFYYKLKYMN